MTHKRNRRSQAGFMEATLSLAIVTFMLMGMGESIAMSTRLRIAAAAKQKAADTAQQSLERFLNLPFDHPYFRPGEHPLADDPADLDFSTFTWHIDAIPERTLRIRIRSLSYKPSTAPSKSNTQEVAVVGYKYDDL